ncbi:MAG: DEAD/DEAH box helicase [Rhodospirillaceae bacterium]
MNTSEMISAIQDTETTVDGIIGLLDKASRFCMNNDHRKSEDAEIVVRILNRTEEFEQVLPGARLIVDAMVREAGLFPYVSSFSSVRDEIAREVHQVPGLAELTFHSMQRSVFSKLQRGQNIVLSAPTSFGKTMLVDALIAAKAPSIVVIVVPTIALLEERRRTLATRFPNYQIITQNFQELRTGPTIIVGTQERILERPDIPAPDLFVIDEFYKLDLTSGDTRAKSLNVLLAKYIDVAKQVYLLGPSIEKNPVDSENRTDFEFIKTDYSPVAADIIHVEPKGADPDTLARVLKERKGESSLVYCRSPKSARVVSRQLADRDFSSSSKLLKTIAVWLRNNYHDNWYLADSLERGIGIHHGRIPRAVGHLMVQLFNKGVIKILLCTSSLIEGVNTVAENVLIYDKYISIRKLDRFTFDNIKGRAGRMFQHFVGRIFVFDDAPDPRYDALDIPLLKGTDELSDQAILQLPNDVLSERNLARKSELLNFMEVPSIILERYAKFGLAEIEKLYLELGEYIGSGNTSLLWTGYGDYPKSLASMEVVWGRVEFEKHGVRSARQFAHFANKLRKNSTLKYFLMDVATGDDVDESIDLAFNFLRGAEYSFVEPLQMLQDMINSLPYEDCHCDYGKFLADLTSWGLPGHTKALEEVGVPAPLIQKICGYIDNFDIDVAVSDVRRLMVSQKELSEADIEILNFTLAES